MIVLEPESDADYIEGPDLPYTAVDWGCGKYLDKIIAACGNDVLIFDRSLTNFFKLLVWPTGLGIHHLNWFEEIEILVGFNSSKLSSSFGFLAIENSVASIASESTKGEKVFVRMFIL